MKLPQPVEQTKAELQNKKDKDATAIKQLKTLTLLTKNDNIAYQEYIEKMWKSLFREEKRLGNARDNQWVYHFLHSAIIALEEKEYFSMSGATLKKKLEKINKHTQNLIKTYTELGIDRPFMTYDPNIFPLFDENGEVITNFEHLQSIGIIDALEYYREQANEEIGCFSQDGKITERHAANRFVKILTKRSMQKYNTPLLAVSAYAALLIFNEAYEQADILNLVKGR